VYDGNLGVHFFKVKLVPVSVSISRLKISAADFTVHPRSPAEVMARPLQAQS
jgi:hypothetical protein